MLQFEVPFSVHKCKRFVKIYAIYVHTYNTQFLCVDIAIITFVQNKYIMCMCIGGKATFVVPESIIH